MRRDTLLIGIIIFLVVLNAGVIGFLIFERASRPKSPELFELITDRLELTQEQQEQFFLLRDKHRMKMDMLDDEFELAVKQYLSLLAMNNPDTVLQDSLENALASIEKVRATITLSHFQQVKALCTPQQQEKFNSLLPDLMRVLLPPKNPNRKDLQK